MKNKTADISIVLDRSGSLESIAGSTIEGFNEFIKTQKAVPVETTLTLAQFDDEYELVHKGIPIGEVPDLDKETFVPRYSTALLDAIGKIIDDTGERLSALPDDQRPAKVAIVIITDGYENDSHQFSWKDINEKISHQREVYKWEFLFLGANQDAIATAANVGIRRSSSLTYTPNEQGTKSAYRSVGESLGIYTSGGSDISEFRWRDWEAQKDAGL